MDARLFLAQQLALGEKIPEKAYEVEVCTEEILFHTKEPYERQGYSRSYTTTQLDEYISFENPQVGYGTYTLSFTNTDFTIEEFNEWLAENPNIIEETKQLQQSAVVRLAELSSVITEALREGEELADKAGLPFIVRLGGQNQDVRKLRAVDWDSSSMYC